MDTSAPKIIGSRDVLQQARGNIVTFLISLAGLGNILYVLLFGEGSPPSAGGVLTLGLMWRPALTAGLAGHFRHILGPRIRNIGRPGDLAVGYVRPISYFLIAYGIMRPEIGWQGFLVPEPLGTIDSSPTALVPGLTRAIYHHPLLLNTDYDRGGLSLYSLAVVALFATSSSFMLTTLRLKMGSIWPGVLLYASQNVVVLHIIAWRTASTELSSYFIGETGAALVAVNAILLSLCWWL